jgi:hypothetical protein
MLEITTYIPNHARQGKQGPSLLNFLIKYVFFN